MALYGARKKSEFDECIVSIYNPFNKKHEGKIKIFGKLIDGKTIEKEMINGFMKNKGNYTLWTTSTIKFKRKDSIYVKYLGKEFKVISSEPDMTGKNSKRRINKFPQWVYLE